MNILLLGSGSRESALATKFLRSKLISCLYIYPKNQVYFINVGDLNSIDRYQIVELPTTKDLDPYSKELLQHLAIYAKNHAIDLVISGPEAYLCAGITDIFASHNITVFGPTHQVSQLEGSKSFAKKIMTEAQIPTACYHQATNKQQCLCLSKSYLKQYNACVLKCSGLAGGKGVFVCFNQQQVDQAIDTIYTKLQSSADQVIIEQYIEGKECSYFAWIHQDKIKSLGFVRDYKRLLDHDQGPNTGGMGAYTPVLDLPKHAQQVVLSKVIHPLINQLKKQSLSYTGFLYVGLIYDQNSDLFSVLEFNIRLGDPECQVLSVHDTSSWFDTTIDLLQLNNNVQATNSSNNHSLKALSMLSDSDNSDQDKTIAVVVSSLCYARFDQKLNPSDLPKPTLALSGDLLKRQVGKDYELMIFPSSNVKKIDPQQTIDNKHLPHNHYFMPTKGRLLTLVAKSNSYSKARQVIYSHLDKIKARWPNIHYRKDIAINLDH